MVTVNPIELAFMTDCHNEVVLILGTLCHILLETSVDYKKRRKLCNIMRKCNLTIV